MAGNQFKFNSDEITRVIELMSTQSPPHHFEFHDPFWVLITTMLSHRTKDQVTDAASRKLFERYDGISGLASASVEDVVRIIDKVGFKNMKAPRIIEAAKIIRDKYGGKVPGSLDELTKIPGVGRKTANVVLSDSFGIPAIAVDTHVQRISRRMGISLSDDPEETEEAIMKIVPRDLWVGLNPMMVEFGKKICKPIGPLCRECSISRYCAYFHDQVEKKSV